MNNRRVGTISMGIVLIAFGILIFFAQFNKVSSFKLAVNIWPGVLVLLGGEILWFSYRDKDEDTKLRYDIFSIFIVFIIVMSSVMLYGMMEIGVLDYVKAKVSESNYGYELPLQDYVVDEDIRKIIIDGDKFAMLNIRVDNGEQIISTGNIDITSDSQEKADNLFAESKVNMDKLGNTLYVSYKGYHNYYGSSLNLIIPSHVDVEISNGGNMDVVMDKVDGNWIIDGGNAIKLRLKKDANVKVQAMVNSEHNLNGNVEWKDTKVGTEENHTHKGELLFGEGTYGINILNVHEVGINEI